MGYGNINYKLYGGYNSVKSELMKSEKDVEENIKDYENIKNFI